MAYVATIYDHLPSVLRMRLELYELSNQEALDLLAKTDAARSKESEVGESDFEEIVTMKEWVSERRARLRGSASIVGRSGQRVKVESGKGIEFVSGYDEREGKDVPRRERVVQGIVFECDPVIGADGYTVEMNVSVETGFGKPTISKQKVVGPASGIEREVERVSISTQAISTAVTLYSGETRLIGCLPSVKEDGQTSVLVFLTATVANP